MDFDCNRNSERPWRMRGGYRSPRQVGNLGREGAGRQGAWTSRELWLMPGKSRAPHDQNEE